MPAHTFIDTFPSERRSILSEPLMEGIKEGSTEPTSSSVGTDCTENEVPTQQLQTDAARETWVESDAVGSLQDFGEASVSTYSFWKGSFVAALLGASMGLLVLAFSWCMYACLCNWIFTLSYKYAVLSTQFAPKSYWIWLPTLGGLAIGTIKLLPLGRYSYPSNVHSFFRKLSSLEVSPYEAPIVVLVSCLSIAIGASVGPEAALGWMSCATAQLFMTALDHGTASFQKHGGARSADSRVIGAGDGGCGHGEMSAGMNPTSSLQQRQRLKSAIHSGRLPERRRNNRSLEQTFLKLNARTLALDTIASGLGALFPTPLLAVVLVQELALASELDFLTSSTYIERCATSLLGTTLCWVVFNRCGGDVILPVASPGSGVLATGGVVSWEPLPNAATSWSLQLCLSSLSGSGTGSDVTQSLAHVGQAILIGAASAGVGLVMLLSMGVFRELGIKCSQWTKHKGCEWVAIFLLPCVAGLCVGILGHALPLTYGDGSFQLTLLTKSLVRGDNVDTSSAQDVAPLAMYSAEYLTRTAAAEVLLLGICHGFGLVGGQISPSLFLGYLVGLIAYLKYGVGLSIAVPCAMAAVPCTLVPAPMTFVVLATTLFGLDGIGSTYVLVSVIASFGANCSLNWLQLFLRQTIKQQLRSAARSQDEGSRASSSFKGSGSGARGCTGFEPDVGDLLDGNGVKKTKAHQRSRSQGWCSNSHPRNNAAAGNRGESFPEDPPIPTTMSTLLYDVLFGDLDDDEDDDDYDIYHDARGDNSFGSKGGPEYRTSMSSGTSQPLQAQQRNQRLLSRSKPTTKSTDHNQHGPPPSLTSNDAPAQAANYHRSKSHYEEEGAGHEVESTEPELPVLRRGNSGAYSEDYRRIF